MAEGIRKINEFVMGAGRTIIITDEKNNYSSFSPGTLFINSNGDVKVKKNNQPDWANLTPANLFTNKSISYNFIADKTLTNQQIANNTIINDNIKDSEINTNKIANSAITSAKLATNSVINDKILDNTIANSKLANKTIQGNKIANLTISTDHLANGCVTSDKLATNAVKANIIEDRSITGIKIALGNINDEHFADKAVHTAKIADGAVTNIKIEYGAITEEKLARNSVTKDKIAFGAVSGDKLGWQSVSTDKIANNAVSTDKIVNGAITGDKLGDYQISTAKLHPSLTQAINSSIKLDSTGTATVFGTLKVTNNINCDGVITAHKVYNAVWNDLAEGYIPGETLEPGTIVEIREDGKVYKASALSKSIVGVISNEYAACYGATQEEIKSGEKVAVGLIGKVHVYVNGPISVGDRIVANENGIGIASTCNASSGIVGKAIETSKKSGIHKVLCLIYPN